MAEPGKPLRFTSSGKFIHTWLLENGRWRLYRVVSYDHQQPVKYPPMFEDGYPFPLFNQDQQIDQLFKKLKISSVSIGLIQDGKLQQVRAFGEQTSGVPVTTETIYKVASLTKPITAMVTLKLIDSGKWSLDEPVSKYYVDPEVKDSPYLNKLTTRRILSQQSGFPNWRYLREDKHLVFEFEPGTKFQYSGEGYEYLRKALEKKFGVSLEQLATDILFKPLGMTDTHYAWPAGMDEHRYAVETGKDGNPLPYQKSSTANGAANLLTTASDYGKFLAYVANGAGLSPGLYKQFITSQTVMKPGIGWGLGTQVFPDLPGDEFALSHSGGDDGVKCLAIVLPKSKRGLIILSNSENGMQVWKKIVGEYFGATGMEIARRNLQ